MTSVSKTLTIEYNITDNISSNNYLAVNTKDFYGQACNCAEKDSNTFYVVTQGPPGSSVGYDPYIYKIENGTVSAGVKIDTITIKDGHRAPSICRDGDGYLHVFYGCHLDTLKYKRSTNPDDISSWTTKTTALGVSVATYPMPFYDPITDKIIVFYRTGTYYGSPFHFYSKESTDNGDTWSTATQRIQGVDNAEDSICPYVTEAPPWMETISGHTCIHFCWRYHDYHRVPQGRVNAYYARFDISDNKFYSVGEVDLGTTVEWSEYPSCLVFDTGGAYTWSSGFIKYLDGTPLYVVNYEYSTGNYKTISLVWNGSNWTDQRDMKTTPHYQQLNSCLMIIDSKITCFEDSGNFYGLDFGIRKYVYDWIAKTWTQYGDLIQPLDVHKFGASFIHIKRQPTTTPTFMFQERLSTEDEDGWATVNALYLCAYNTTSPTYLYYPVYQEYTYYFTELQDSIPINTQYDEVYAQNYIYSEDITDVEQNFKLETPWAVPDFGRVYDFQQYTNDEFFFNPYKMTRASSTTNNDYYTPWGITESSMMDYLCWIKTFVTGEIYSDNPSVVLSSANTTISYYGHHYAEIIECWGDDFSAPYKPQIKVFQITGSGENADVVKTTDSLGTVRPYVVFEPLRTRYYRNNDFSYDTTMLYTYPESISGSATLSDTVPSRFFIEVMFWSPGHVTPAVMEHQFAIGGSDPPRLVFKTPVSFSTFEEVASFLEPVYAIEDTFQISTRIPDVFASINPKKMLSLEWTLGTIPTSVILETDNPLRGRRSLSVTMASYLPEPSDEIIEYYKSRQRSLEKWHTGYSSLNKYYMVSDFEDYETIENFTFELSESIGELSLPGAIGGDPIPAGVYVDTSHLLSGDIDKYLSVMIRFPEYVDLSYYTLLSAMAKADEHAIVDVHLVDTYGNVGFNTSFLVGTNMERVETIIDKSRLATTKIQAVVLVFRHNGTLLIDDIALLMGEPEYEFLDWIRTNALSLTFNRQSKSNTIKIPHGREVFQNFGERNAEGTLAVRSLNDKDPRFLFTIEQDGEPLFLRYKNIGLPILVSSHRERKRTSTRGVFYTDIDISFVEIYDNSLR